MHLGILGLSVCPGTFTKKLSLRLTGFLYTMSIIPVAQSSSKMIRTGIRVLTPEFINLFLTMQDSAKYAINVRHDIKQ